MTYVQKKSFTANSVPSPSSILTAEIAINLVDHVLYSKDASNNVFRIVADPVYATGLQTKLDLKLNSANSVFTTAQGTAPFAVSSNTVVINLNSHYLGGQLGSYYLNYNNLSNKPTLTTSLNALSDVQIVGLASGKALVYNGTKWTANNIATSLTTLTDTAIVSPFAGEFLVYNGTKWVANNISVSLQSLTDTQINSPSIGQSLVYNGFKWVANNSTASISTLSDTEVTSPQWGELLTFDGFKWVGGHTELALLSDVNTSGVSLGKSLVYNGVEWTANNAFFTVTDYGSNPTQTQVLNITGDGANLVYSNGNVTINIPGQPPNSTVLSMGLEVTSDYTLLSSDDNTIIPITGFINVTVPVGLANNFACVFLQNSSQQFNIIAASGVVINAPEGLTSQGEFSTIALIQVSPDVWLATVGGGRSSSSQSTNQFSSTATKGILIIGGAAKGAGGANATYTRLDSDNLVTVTWNNHSLTADAHNGRDVLLVRGTGALGSPIGTDPYTKTVEMCTNFLYLDSNTFSCISSNTTLTSGDLEVNPCNMYYPMTTLFIPAGILGLNGLVKSNAVMSHNVSGYDNRLALFFVENAETNSWYFTSESAPNRLYGESVNGGYYLSQNCDIKNRNSANSQVCTISNTNTGTALPAYKIIDTTSDTKMVFGIQLADPTDWAMLEYAYIEIIPFS